LIKRLGSKGAGNNRLGLAPIKLGLAVAIGIGRAGNSKGIISSEVGALKLKPSSANLFFIIQI